MKQPWKIVVFLFGVVMLLAGCLPGKNQPQATPADTTPVQTGGQVQASPTAQATLDRTADLPDPAGWAAALHIPPEEYPRVDGSTATLPLGIYLRSKITGESLGQSDAATRFTTTGPAWEALVNRAADLLVVYEAPDEVKERLTASGVKLLSKPVGLDALVFLTNQGNPVGSLTRQQIVDIYTGKIKNWKEVGGADLEIIPYQRVSNSGSQALMKKLVMKSAPMMDAPTVLRPAEMDDLMDAVAQYDNSNNALGYSVYYYVRNMYKVPSVKLLAVDGVHPAAETIASGQYPYINPFYAVIREDEPKESPAYRLFDWLTGAEGARAVADAGYVAVE